MNHILEMKAHSETHFENENMFLEKRKLINPCLTQQQRSAAVVTLIKARRRIREWR